MLSDYRTATSLKNAARHSGETGTGGIKELVKRVVRDAIVGGVASRLGGGKFGNGAVTAAFARMFNDERHARYKEHTDKELESTDSDKIHVEKGAKISQADLSKAFDSVTTLAKTVQEITTPQEYSEELFGGFYDGNSTSFARDKQALMLDLNQIGVELRTAQITGGIKIGMKTIAFEMASAATGGAVGAVSHSLGRIIHGASLAYESVQIAGQFVDHGPELHLSPNSADLYFFK